MENKITVYYKKEGRIKALFKGLDDKLYLNDGNGNMVPYNVEPEPTTSVSSPSDDNSIKLDFSHVNNASIHEVATRVETREPVKLSHLTRAGQELFKRSGKNTFCHAVWRGKKSVWVWTGSDDSVE